jgi:F0F1-type ATP synthase assembly protein I
VQHAAESPMKIWETFYVIVGSSAAALTGLQFVVIALLTETRRPSTPRQIDAFATPTIVHFCAVLLLSALVTAPWPGLLGADLALGACGCAGVVYAAVVIRRTRSQTSYRPVFEDWLCHAVLPMTAYASLLVAAVTLGRYPVASLFAVAVAALLLLFVGIHNAWDTVTFIALDHVQGLQETEKKND